MVSWLVSGLLLSQSSRASAVWIGTPVRTELFCTDFNISEVRQLLPEPFASENEVLSTFRSETVLSQSAHPAAAKQYRASEGC